MAEKKVGILTGGGDCPGLNPAIRGAVLKGLDFNWEIIGINEGWKGLACSITEPLSLEKVKDIMNQGGTILGTSRYNPYKVDGGVEKVLKNASKICPDGLIVMGGEDTLGVAHRLYKEQGFPVVGVPKTMDNDLSATDYTFGFDTSVTLAVKALEILRDTGRSHRRIMVLEVMGRHAGWVALYTAIAGGADWVLIPEEEPDIEKMCAHLKKVHEREKVATVVVSEGVKMPELKNAKEELDQFGHMILKKRGVGDRIAEIVEEKLGVEARVGVIGHMQRGGPATVFDRMLGVRTGVKASELVGNGKFGNMACLKGNSIEAVPLSEAVSVLKTVTPEWVDFAKTLFK